MPSSQPDPPQAPNAAQNYQEGIQTFLRFLPRMMSAEYNQRKKWDPKMIEQQLGFQEQYGPRQYQDMINAQRQLDPYGTAMRAQLGTAVSRDLALGTHLDPASQQQLQTEIRGAQAARGNVSGNAGISGEALYQGRAAQQLYQQRLQNAGNFMQLRTPEADMAFIPGVQAPDQFRLVNPNAGVQGQQIGQQGFQNQLAAYSLGNQQQGGGWGGALSGAAGGATAGSSFGVYGAAAGAALGGTAGYFSDSRIKENIVDTGERTKDGIPRVIFNYIGLKQRYKGLLAQDVLKVRPDAVWQTRGILGVFYGLLGEKMEEV